MEFVFIQCANFKCKFAHICHQSPMVNQQSNFYPRLLVRWKRLETMWRGPLTGSSVTTWPKLKIQIWQLPQLYLQQLLRLSRDIPMDPSTNWYENLLNLISIQFWTLCGFIRRPKSGYYLRLNPQDWMAKSTTRKGFRFEDFSALNSFTTPPICNIVSWLVCPK